MAFGLRQLADRLKGIPSARAGLALPVTAGTLAGVATLVQALLLSSVVDLAFLAGAGLDDCLPLLLGMAGMAGARAALLWLQEVGGQRYSTRVRRVVRDQGLRHLIAHGPVRMAHRRSGAIAQALVGGVDAMDAYLSQYLPQVALAVLVPGLIATTVTIVDPLSGLVLWLTLPLIPLFMALIGSRAREETRRQWTAMTRLSARFLDALQALPTLRAFGAAYDEARTLAAAGHRHQRLTMKVLRLAFVSSLTLEALATLGTAIVAVEVGLRLLYGHIFFGPALFVLVLTPELYRPLRALGAAFHAGMTGQEAMEELRRIVDAPGPPVAPALLDASARASASPGIGSRPSLRLDDVRVRYAGQRAPALDGFSLAVRGGSTVALVGPSGAGKSTVLHLLLGYVAAESGRLLVDEQDLATLRPEHWRQHVAWLPQAPRLYLTGATLRENVLIARPEASASDLEEAAGASYLTDVLAALPRGWETLIGEGGTRLSGGQAQRLALARAFLARRPVLLLDEPTAQLDLESEEHVTEALRRLRRGRTVLMVAHRLTTVLDADHVAVVSSGRVIEEGAPAVLGRSGAVFPRLLAAWRGAA